MTKRIVTAACAASVLSLSIAGAQTTNTPAGAQGNRGGNAAPQQQETTVVGCVARATGAPTQNATFMLNNVQTGATANATAGVTGSTSAPAGASTSGTAGTTASGTSGSTASGTGRATDQGGSTAQDGGRQSPAANGQRTAGNAQNSTSYMLVAGANQNLANYVGQRVEIRGRLVGNAADNRQNGSAPSASTTNDRSANNTARFQVTSVRPAGGTCE